MNNTRRKRYFISIIAIVAVVVSRLPAAIADIEPPRSIFLEDQNTWVTYDDTQIYENWRGLIDWGVDGRSHLYEQSFWFNTEPPKPLRLPSTPIVRLSPTAKIYDYNKNDPEDDERLRVSHRCLTPSTDFVINVDYVVLGQTPKSRKSFLYEYIEITNFSDSDLNLRLYLYNDFDLGDSTHDKAYIKEWEGKTVMIQKNLSGQSTYLIAEPLDLSPSTYGIAVIPEDEDSPLLPFKSGSLGNKGSGLQGDISWAWHWNIYLEPGESQSFKLRFGIFPILPDSPPEPTIHFIRVTRAGEGSGAVRSTPLGIDCGTDCTEPYDMGKEITLSATPDDGSIFTGWTGGGCDGSTEDTCKVTMNSDKTVTATFNFPLLTVDKAGTGKGTVRSSPAGIDCGDGCSEDTEEYELGTKVTLSATPDPVSVFSGWSGEECDGSTEDTCTITMNSDKTVTATFTPLYLLTVTKAGTGKGTVRSSPAGIDCGDGCSEDTEEYELGMKVTLSATPDPVSVFSGWSGEECDGSTEDTCTITMNSDKTVTARFTLRKYTISGYVHTASGAGIPGVEVYGLPGNPITDPNGYYEAKVDFFWEGTAIPQSYDYAFDPPSRSYEFTVTDQTNQDYIAKVVDTYFGFDPYGGRWHDAEQLGDGSDDNMDWAAAAANILDWAGWGTLEFDSETDIFYNFCKYWPNDPVLIDSIVKDGWRWWFHGDTTIHGGKHWPDVNFFEYYHRDWMKWDQNSWRWYAPHLMETMDDYFHSGYGVTLYALRSGGQQFDQQQWLTGWGYALDETTGNYTGIWVTDSDDSLTGMKLLSVQFDLDEDFWYFEMENRRWYIGGVEALGQNPNPVPEPGTLLLLGLGLISLIVRKRRTLKR